jgi:hypothetical protein
MGHICVHKMIQWGKSENIGMNGLLIQTLSRRCPESGYKQVGRADGRMKAVGLNTVRIQIGSMSLSGRTGEGTDDSLVNHTSCEWRTILGRSISISQSRRRLGSDSGVEGEITRTAMGRELIRGDD